MESFKNDDRRQQYEKQLYEMHSRAQMPPVPPFVKMPQTESKVPDESQTEVAADTVAPPQGTPKKGALFGRDLLKLIDLKNFEMDSDRMLLLFMILLLSVEESDEILLLALAYLML